MKENETIGRNLRILREANRYTQEQVSGFLGINRSAYANYETGEREMPINLLEKACDLMGCELDAMFIDDMQTVKNMLVCAFRADELSTEDMKEVAAFKRIVLNYIKMNSMLGL